jgi:hypothetical protein
MRPGKSHTPQREDHAMEYAKIIRKSPTLHKPYGKERPEGSALSYQLSLIKGELHLCMDVARQLTLANLKAGQHATFDWKHKKHILFNFEEMAQLSAYHHEAIEREFLPEQTLKFFHSYRDETTNITLTTKAGGNRQSVHLNLYVNKDAFWNITLSRAEFCALVRTIDLGLAFSGILPEINQEEAIFAGLKPDENVVLKLREKFLGEELKYSGEMFRITRKIENAATGVIFYVCENVQATPNSGPKRNLKCE